MVKVFDPIPTSNNTNCSNTSSNASVCNPCRTVDSSSNSSSNASVCNLTGSSSNGTLRNFIWTDQCVPIHNDGVYNLSVTLNAQQYSPFVGAFEFYKQVSTPSVVAPCVSLHFPTALLLLSYLLRLVQVRTSSLSASVALSLSSLDCAPHTAASCLDNHQILNEKQHQILNEKKTDLK